MLVVFTISLGLCLAAVAQLAWGGYLILRWAREAFSLSSPDVCGLCKATVANLRLLLVDSPQDPLEQKVRELELAGRIQSIKTFLKLVIIGNTAFLIRDFFFEQRWRLVAQCWSSTHSEAETSRGLALWSLVILRQLLPVVYLSSSRLRAPIGLRVGVAILFVRFGFESLLIDSSAYPFWLASILPGRIATCVFLAEIHTTTFMNASLCMLCLRHHAVSSYMTCRIELAVCFSTILMIKVLRDMREAHIRSMLEAKALRSVEATADGLLSRLCDAVVHLGEDLRITQPSPQLATLLLRPPSPEGLQGTHLSDLSASRAESERLLSFIRRDAQDGAGSLHTSFRDSNACAVEVQLYHIQGCDADDHNFHVVGVCEDTGSFRVPPAASASAASQFGRGSSPSTAPPPQDSSTASLGSVRSVRQHADVTVCFRPMGDGYPIERCSEGFAALTGTSPPGARLLSRVRGSPDDFIEEVQKAVMAWHVSRDPRPCRFSTLRLTPVHAGAGASVELRADVVLSMGHNAGSEDVRSWTVMASLSDVKEAWPRRDTRPAPAGARPATQPPLGAEDERRAPTEGDLRRRPTAAAAPQEC